MIRTLMRLAPSQAGGKLLSGTVMGGGNSCGAFATGVPSSFSVKPDPLESVPQFEGGLPGRGVIVQQVMKLRTRKKLAIARTSPTTMRIICITEGRPHLMFLRKFILFIRV